MTKKMLIDATHPEETRVAVISGSRLEEYDYETLVRKQLKSNIYLVKVTRVEPSLQAAFVDFGGNRHGFLPFPEIHPDYYRIPIADREALLAEERALAEEQAKREEEEDAAALAELAAAGEDIEDIENIDVEDEDDGDDDDDEEYVPQHTGSIAEEIVQESLIDNGDDDGEGDDNADDADDADDETAATAEDCEEETEDTAGAEDTPDTNGDTENDDDPETIGGDVVETPVFRSSIKRKYKIQEVIKRNQIMLVQISKEERGNKGAAVTSYISLPGRYCVLMPNSPRGGGVSRKVSNAKDRHRLKKILQELNVPDGMSVILRTAGVSRSKAEIKRDLDYLLRLWDQIRELTLKSTAPALIYEEGNLIKRAIRDLYRRDIDEVHVAGEQGYKTAHDFMKTLMPSHASRIQLYQDDMMPLFYRHQVEKQIDEIHNPTVHLKSGGYIVINPTEALVSVDVNSGRATKGRHIEETALKTNIEAAEEIARQLRLRDMGGLVVIDFIDMEDKRNNRIVERKLRDAMQSDRARIQLGRISAFGLLELSRQRLHPSLVETNFEVCKHCNGTGLTRTIETAAVIVLRAIEQEGIRTRNTEIRVSVPTDIALYIFNHKRDMLAAIEKHHNIHVSLHADDSLIKPGYVIESLRAAPQERKNAQRHAPVQTVDMSDLPDIAEEDITDDSTVADDARDDDDDTREKRTDRNGDREERRSRRGRRGGRNRRDNRDDRRRNRGAADDSGGSDNAIAPLFPDSEQPSDDGLEANLQTRDTRVDNAEGEDTPRRRRTRGGRNRGGRNRRRAGDKKDDKDGGEADNAPSGRDKSGDNRDALPATGTDGGAIPERTEANAEEGHRKGWWKRLTE